MDYTFSKAVEALKPSAIREILKYASVPGMISFAAGNPAPEAFPVEAISGIMNSIMAERPIEALQYNITEGYTPLRDHLKTYMAQKHDSFKSGDELIITSGAQQVMALAAQALCDTGDTVICEEPSFIGSLNAFRAQGLSLCGVPLDADGMDIARLENALKTQKNVRFIYVIPTFQNPSGVTTSLAKRKEIYRLASKYNVLILEDNPYSDLRFAGEHVPTIKSMDTEGRVIYAGSFSKVLSPGIRVGFAIAPAPVLAKMVVCKQVADVHTTILCQMAAHRFMTEQDYESHLSFLANLYGKKASLMLTHMKNELSSDITYNPPEGGLFVWCSLPGGANMPEFCKSAVQQNVAVVPGNAFLMNENTPCRHFRMNYSTPTDEQIEKGIAVLGKVPF